MRQKKAMCHAARVALITLMWANFKGRGDLHRDLT